MILGAATFFINSAFDVDTRQVMGMANESGQAAACRRCETAFIVPKKRYAACHSSLSWQTSSMRVLISALLACSLTSVSHASLVSLSMQGFVTQMPPIGQDLPAPWNAAVVGDPWSLILTFEDATTGFPSGAQTWFPGFARAYTFTLGGATASGTLPAVPGASQAFVQNGVIDYLGFDFVVTQGPIRFGTGLTDLDGTAFSSQSVLPTSLATQDFEIRDAGIWRANGGSPQAAMRFSVTSVVPAPHGAAIAALGGLVAARRRRVVRAR